MKQLVANYYRVFGIALGIMFAVLFLGISEPQLDQVSYSLSLVFRISGSVVCLLVGLLIVQNVRRSSATRVGTFDFHLEELEKRLQGKYRSVPLEAFVKGVRCFQEPSQIELVSTIDAILLGSNNPTPEKISHVMSAIRRFREGSSDTF